MSFREFFKRQHKVATTLVVVPAAAATIAATLVLFNGNSSRRVDESSSSSSSLMMRPDQSIVCKLIEKEVLTKDTSRFRFGLPTTTEHNNNNNNHNNNNNRQRTRENLLSSSSQRRNYSLYHVLAHDDAMISRAYTPITDIDTLLTEEGYFDLIIKEYPGGEFSPLFHRMVIRPPKNNSNDSNMNNNSNNDTMQFRGPIVTLPYKPNIVRCVGMIAAGTGITPMYQLIRTVLLNSSSSSVTSSSSSTTRNNNNENCNNNNNDLVDQTRLVLLYANKSVEDILLKDELDQLMKQYPNQFLVHYIVEEEGKKRINKSNTEDDTINANRNEKEQRKESYCAPTSTISIGRVNASTIKEYLPSSTDNDVSILICGPNGMLNFLCGSAIHNRGTAPQQLQRSGGLLANMGYSHQVLVLSDVGVQRLC